MTIDLVTPIKYVEPAYMDPTNSVDLFDYNRENDSGEMYCVAAAILPEQVDFYWEEYVRLEFENA